MKVYVMTKARPLKLFGVEAYLGVKKSKKEAERELRNLFPHMRKSERSFPDAPDTYYSDKNTTFLLFIHEEEI